MIATARSAWFAILATFTLCAAAAHADPAKFAAIWTKPATAGDAEAHHDMTSAQYQAKVTALAAKGLGPRMVNGYLSNGVVLFAAVFHKESAAWMAHHDLDSAAYQQKFDQYVQQGYRLEWVSGYPVNGVPHFAGVWSKAGGPAWAAHHQLDSTAYQAKFNEHKAQGYRPSVVNPYVVNGAVHYAAIFVKEGVHFEAHHALTAADYQAKFNQLAAQGMFPDFIGGYDLGGATHVSAVWLKPAHQVQVRHDLPSAAYQQQYDAQLKNGFGLKIVSGYGR